MRLLGLLLITGSLAACDNSEQLEQARAEGRAEAAAEAQRLALLSDQQDEAQAEYEACVDDAAEARETFDRAMRDARDNIMTGLDNVSTQGSDGALTAGFAFRVQIESLTAEEWAWVETEEAAVADGYNDAGVSDRISYEVDPRQLSNRVQLVTYNGMPAVQIDCASGNCIRARGRRVGFYNGQQAFEDIDERRDHNVWALENSNRAQVVRDALATLIGGAKGGAPTASCTAPAAE